MKFRWVANFVIFDKFFNSGFDLLSLIYITPNRTVFTTKASSSMFPLISNELACILVNLSNKKLFASALEKHKLLVTTIDAQG